MDREFARHDLVLVARDEHDLKQAAAGIEDETGVKVTTHALDLVLHSMVDELLKRLATTQVDLLVDTGVLILCSILINAALPDPGLHVEKSRTALVVADPQNDFLSPKGVTWGVVGKSVTANNTVENIETLLKSAKANGIPAY